MKLLKCICFFTLLTLANVYAADPVSKPQRLGDDSKIIGYVLIKEPNNFLAKFIKLSNIIYPGSGVGIEQQASMIKPILDSSVSIAVVFYSNVTFEQTPFVGIYITVKDKTVFNNPMLNMMPTKEVVDNTLIVSTDPNGLAKFKDLLKNVLTLKAQKDIEAHIDLKNIIKLKDEAITRDMPYAKAIFSQAEMATIKLDLQDAGIEYSSSLITADKSNLQTMLVQPSADSTALLKYVGAGNFASIIANYDLSKCKGFVQDVIKMANSIPEVGESEKKLLKELEPTVLAICDMGSMSSASSMSFKEFINSKGITKLKDPNLLIKLIKTCFSLLSSEGFKSLLGKTEFKEMYEFKIEEVEKINGAQVYKIGTLSKKQEEEMKKLMVAFPKDQFISVDANYCYSTTDIASLKELIENVKTSPKAEIALESLKYFKTGNSIYSDVYLVGYIKFLEGIARPFGLKLDTLLALKLPPLKVAITLDGNATVKSFIETATISTLVQEGIKAWEQSNVGANPNMGGSEDNPKSQP